MAMFNAGCTLLALLAREEGRRGFGGEKSEGAGEPEK